MQALKDATNYQEVLEDLNNMVFSCIEPKTLARIVWKHLEQLIAEGVSEEGAYTFIKDQIQTTNPIDEPTEKIVFISDDENIQKHQTNLSSNSVTDTQIINDTQRWINYWKHRGAIMAHPLDAWVHPQNNTIMINYPIFVAKELEVGDKIILGWPASKYYIFAELTQYIGITQHNKNMWKFQPIEINLRIKG